MDEIAKTEFEMNDQQFDAILAASKPVPYLIVGGEAPRSPRENANAAWQQLGREMGFDWQTVEPIEAQSARCFKAVPT